MCVLKTNLLLSLLLPVFIATWFFWSCFCLLLHIYTKNVSRIHPHCLELFFGCLSIYLKPFCFVLLGGLIYAVNGESAYGQSALPQGFVISYSTKEILDYFSPDTQVGYFIYFSIMVEFFSLGCAFISLWVNRSSYYFIYFALLFFRLVIESDFIVPLCPSNMYLIYLIRNTGSLSPEELQGKTAL